MHGAAIGGSTATSLGHENFQEVCSPTSWSPTYSVHLNRRGPRWVSMPGNAIGDDLKKPVVNEVTSAATSGRGGAALFL